MIYKRNAVTEILCFARIRLAVYLFVFRVIGMYLFDEYSDFITLTAMHGILVQAVLPIY